MDTSKYHLPQEVAPNVHSLVHSAKTSPLAPAAFLDSTCQKIYVRNAPFKVVIYADLLQVTLLMKI